MGIVNRERPIGGYAIFFIGMFLTFGIAVFGWLTGNDSEQIPYYVTGLWLVTVAAMVIYDKFLEDIFEGDRKW